jgi:UDP-N-acetylmuramate: L-alanyl-gamma-D-glutamyl-meso-diaminopimelate ligase
MRIFVTAVAGTGMGSLAGLLKELGHDVAGSDIAFDPPMGPALRQWGIRLYEGFKAEHLSGKTTFGGDAPEVSVIGNVCRKDNPEAVAALELGIERIHIADALRRFALKGTAPLVVTGTHGKTTTSSLCAHLLRGGGLDPGFLIGGVPESLGKGFHPAGKRKLGDSNSHAGVRATPFVLEGDEYDTAFWEKSAKFLHYQAEVAIMTSIEHDHIDIYPAEKDYVDAFVTFARSLPEDGLLIAYAGDPRVVEVSKEASCNVAYYALHGEDPHGVAPHWLAAPAEETPQGTSFDLFAGGVLAGRFVSPLSGSHNLRNATAALAASAQGYGVPLPAMMEPLAHFRGVKRRQELIGTPRSISVYDDFAHHPTAVKETLDGLRRRHPSGKMIAVFEPRSATACRRLHQEAYVSAFDSATHIVLPPVGRPGLPEAEKLDVPALCRDLSARTVGNKSLESVHLPTVDAIVGYVGALAEPGDTVAVLSNGAFGGIHAKLLSALESPSGAD